MSTMLQPNTVVHNRYRIVRLIGWGGMGTVYEAIDQTFQNRVALKQMFPPLNVSPKQMATMERAFEREARILHGLRHPALPLVSDYFSDDAGRFLVMDYIEGQDLQSYLDERMEQHGNPFAEQEVVAWSLKVLEALQYLHEHSPPVIHRDIKPNNIKVTPAGKIFLIDFGIAKGIASSSIHAYTQAYAPLEQIQGKGTEPRSDLFSLGATMYHLLTGQPPPSNAVNRALQTTAGQPDPLVLPSSISQPVQEVMQQALALDKKDRPASAAAMWQMLYAAMNYPHPLPSAPPPVMPNYPPKKAVPTTLPASNPITNRTWLWVGALVTVLVLLVGGTFGAFAIGGNEPEPTATPTMVAGLPVTTPTNTATSTPQPSSTPTQLIITPLPPSPTPTPLPPPLGKIAFVSARDGNAEIYVIQADGSNLQQLTTNPASDWRPTWFTDGSRLAFSSDRNGNFEIYTMSSDGSNPQRITTTEADDYQPVWSPDGSRIAFVSNPDGNFEVYIMTIDGSEPVINLTTNTSDDGTPDWSPDGSRIAFRSWRSGNAEIYTIRSDGSGLQRLTTTSADEYIPVWSPDSSRIAFVSERDGNGEIYIMNANGSNQVNLTNHEAGDYDPTWSPDGTHIAFTSERDGNPEIYIMHADGSNPQRLTNNEDDDYAPAWSP